MNLKSLFHIWGIFIPSYIKQKIIYEKFELSGIPGLRQRILNADHPITPFAIVTRAYNRLEYTVQCVDSVARQMVNIPYIHVIIDQVSEDGTEQWFNWILKLKKPFWKNVCYLRLNKNLGDWGGTTLGHCILHDKYQRFMQLDNDYMLVSQYALENLNYALDFFPGNSMVMCRRLGSGATDGSTGGDVPLKKISKQYKVKLKYGESRIYKVLLAVSSYMCSRDTINKALQAGCDAACKLCDSLTPRGSSFKLHDVLSQHIQGWDDTRFLQHEKYYLGSVATGKNYTRIQLSDIISQPTNFINYAIPPASDSAWLKPDIQIKQQWP
jgi:hypothetical protein